MQEELSAIDAAADRLLAAAGQGALTEELAEETARTIKENAAKLKQE